MSVTYTATLPVRDQTGQPAQTVAPGHQPDVELLREALNAASNDRLRRAIATVVLTDAEYAEIADREGTTPAAIKQMLYRYRQTTLIRVHPHNTDSHTGSLGGNRESSSHLSYAQLHSIAVNGTRIFLRT